MLQTHNETIPILGKCEVIMQTTRYTKELPFFYPLRTRTCNTSNTPIRLWFVQQSEASGLRSLFRFSTVESNWFMTVVGAIESSAVSESRAAQLSKQSWQDTLVFPCSGLHSCKDRLCRLYAIPCLGQPPWTSTIYWEPRTSIWAVVFSL
ncbi:hypothetical protein BDY19DRAFT_382016 [Irpex rosettiformis]|uniref:Uncharacterized protein n=1 Tax=Irpex rosettiformis TaxID=378272 RepID=A0ACB8TV08_9APHY|nr:hypothetical protein BDY19DRAFT_382016 [Irpex rosettiformis]